MDLQTAQIVVGIVVAVVGVVATVFGWFGKLWNWIAGFFHPSSPGLLDIPRKTLVLVRNPRSNAFWWHMGSSGDQPAMQIIGDITATNICKYGVYVTAAKMKKPKAWGHADVKDLNSQYSGRYMIPKGGMTDLRFHFWIMPPVKEKGQSLKADVAILDQFGNEHWLKGVEFPYT